MTPQTCPRRSEIGNTEEFKDFWVVGTTLAGYKDDKNFRSCSYCGSIHPDDVLTYISKGWYLIPTDKDYKAYLGKPFAQKIKINITGAAINSVSVGKLYYQHFDEIQAQEFIDLFNMKVMNIDYPGHFTAIPMFMTLVKKS